MPIRFPATSKFSGPPGAGCGFASACGLGGGFGGAGGLSWNAQTRSAAVMVQIIAYSLPMPSFNGISRTAYSQIRSPPSRKLIDSRSREDRQELVDVPDRPQDADTVTRCQESFRYPLKFQDARSGW